MTARGPSNRNAEVDRWLEERRHPLDDAIRLARSIILEADDRITESIKWSTPTFSYRGNLASFNPSKKVVSILFHRGAEIPGAHPRLEGEGRLVRTMRLASVDDVESARGDLERIVQAWCDSRPE